MFSALLFCFLSFCCKAHIFLFSAFCLYRLRASFLLLQISLQVFGLVKTVKLESSGLEMINGLVSAAGLVRAVGFEKAMHGSTEDCTYLV